MCVVCVDEVGGIVGRALEILCLLKQFAYHSKWRQEISRCKGCLRGSRSLVNIRVDSSIPV